MAAVPNWTKYAADYPDLAAAGLTTPEQLAKHWQEHGQYEGRKLAHTSTPATPSASINTTWKAPANAEGWVGPGFAKQWEFQSGASENGGGFPELGNTFNWSSIPNLPPGLFKPAGMGDMPGVDNYVLDRWLTENGYEIKQSGAGGDVGFRWIQDRVGNVIGEPTAFSKGTDKAFLGASLAAMGITGANILAAGFTAGGAPAASLSSGSSAVPGVGGSVDPFSLGGSYVPETVGATPLSTGATNPALIESAVGTPGYGVSSATPGFTPAVGGGTLSMGEGGLPPATPPGTPLPPAAPSVPPAVPPLPPTLPTPTPPIGGVPTPPGTGPIRDPLSTGSAIGDKVVGGLVGAGAGAIVNTAVGSPPTGPNTADTIAAQTRADIDTANINTANGRPNVTNPFGSSTWTRVADASMPGGFRWENNIAFSPEQQGLYDSTVGNQQSLLDTSGKLLSEIDKNYSTPFDFGKYGTAQTIDNSPDAFSAQRDAVQSALYERLMRTRTPQMERDRAQMDLSLRNQGLTPGSEAYDNAMRGLREAQSGEIQDYNSRSVEAGGLEQTRLNTDFRSNAGFNNTVRSNSINEGLTQRNMPLTEYNALTQGTQPTLPTFQPYGTGTVQPTNVSGIQQQGYNSAQDTYNARMAQYQNLLNFGVKVAGG